MYLNEPNSHCPLSTEQLHRAMLVSTTQRQPIIPPFHASFHPMSSSQDATEQTPLIPIPAASASSRQEKMSAATFWKIGALYGAAAVGFGAFGAHGLKKHIADPAKLANWSTAAHYQVCTSPPLGL